LLDIILIGLFVGVLLSAVYMVLKSFPCCDRGHRDDGKSSKDGGGGKGSQGGDDDKGSKGSDETRKLKKKVDEAQKTEIVTVVKTSSSSLDNEAKVLNIRQNSEKARQAMIEQVKQREEKADARVQEFQEARKQKSLPTVEKPSRRSDGASVVKQLTKNKEIAPKVVRKGARPAAVTKKVSKSGSGGNGRGKASDGKTSSGKAKASGNAEPVVKPVVPVKSRVVQVKPVVKQ